MEMDLHEVSNIPKCILNLYGLWPDGSKTMFAKVRGLFTILSLFSFCNLMLAEYIHTRKDMRTSLAILTISTPLVSFMMKWLVFLRYEKQFLTTYEFLREKTFSSVPDNLRMEIVQPMRFGRIVGIVYQINCAITVTFYNIIPFMMEQASLPVPLTFIDYSSFYTAMYIYQFFNLFAAAANNSSLDYIAIGLMSIIKGQLCIVKEKIRSYGEMGNDQSGTSDSEIIAYLSECVNHHDKIFRLVALVEKVFSMLLLIQYLTSIMVICNIGFQLVIVESLSFSFLLMFSFFLAMICQLGMYCWFGNEIIVHSSAIRDACYESDWINSSIKVRKMLLIIMERSKRPMYLTAGKFSILSLASFMSVINSAYSFFALMQTMYMKSEHN